MPRTAGTPQGGVVSPCLANLFLHYAFDMWMARNFPAHPVREIRGRHYLPLSKRGRGAGTVERPGGPLRACRLVLHPQKTKLVYCKDANRRGTIRSSRSTSSAMSFVRGRRSGVVVGSVSRSCPRLVRRR